jgi:hypothetical protein
MYQDGSWLHLALGNLLFGGACASLPEQFKQRAHDALYGIHHELPVGQNSADMNGLGTLADQAASEATGYIAIARGANTSTRRILCSVIDRKASWPAHHRLSTTSGDVTFELRRGVHQLYPSRTVVVANSIKNIFK